MEDPPQGGGYGVIRAQTPECCPDCHQNLATFRKYGEFLLTEDPPQGWGCGGRSEVILAHSPGIFPDRREIFIAAGKHRSRLDTEILT